MPSRSATPPHCFIRWVSFPPPLLQTKSKLKVHAEGHQYTTHGPVLYSENFDRRGVGSSWCRSKHGSTCKVEHGGPSGTGRSMRISHKPSRRGSAVLQKVVKISARMSAALSFDVLFENDFEWVRGGKLGAGLW